MPRFYNLTLYDPSTGKIATRQDGSQFTWGTNNSAGNAYDAGALNIEFDAPISYYHEPVGGVGITIYGVSLQDLLQANQFAGTQPGNGMILRLYGGMSAGLPLVNPKQAGLLVEGVVVQSWGNWIGTEMTLELIVVASAFTPENPGNIVLNWRANTPLSQALQQTLSTAYPGVKINISISPQLMLTHDEVGYQPTLEALAQVIQGITPNQIVSDTYGGVFIAYQGGQIYVTDGTIPPTAAPTTINFTDLVGQPTWIGINLMQFVCVLRADISLGTIIKMPAGLQSTPGAVTTTAQSAPNGLKYKSTFTGMFEITQARHIGNLRAADGLSWISVFNCIPYSASSS